MIKHGIYYLIKRAAFGIANRERQKKNDYIWATPPNIHQCMLWYTNGNHVFVDGVTAIKNDCLIKVIKYNNKKAW
jgi:hypothetical protein